MNPKIKKQKHIEKYKEFETKHKNKSRNQLLDEPIPLGVDGLIYVYYLRERLNENN